ncbi:somatostatin receptor type 2-like [Acanthaster planci]|uniref:Somatostatin receptor type 2-like n=1 Tax=Acanthaster planci TaxID=133434 RepID=A0A8B7XXE1_ACAPL|nr:somatostatin receptor type 2-like [Acanthaster planci]XP_022085548.1 somatostatin receptor type 2-like [Acanthaster planci]XP_022085550.1 somatostatin receptor type 2-like [Acanthaster planci]
MAANITTEEPSQDTLGWIYILTGSLSYVVCIIGLLANTWVIWVLLRRLGLKTAGNMYILNLAIADDLFLAGLALQAAYQIKNIWPFGEFLCRAALAFDGLNMYASAFFVTALSIERYMAVSRSSRARLHRKRRQAAAVSVVIWIAAILAALPTLLASTYMYQEHQNGSYHLCITDFTSFGQPGRQFWTQAFITYNFVLGLCVPLTVSCFCYGRLIVQMREVSMRNDAGADIKRVTRIVTGVVVVFFLCWAPFYICRMILVYNRDLNYWDGRPFVFEISLLLTYINSCVNPFIYALISEKFRENLPCVSLRGRGYKSGKRTMVCDRNSTALTDIQHNSVITHNESS